MCVGDELTDDSASTLQRSKSKRSTFPSGAAGVAGVAPGRAVAVFTSVVWGEWRLGMGLERPLLCTIT